MTFLDFVNRNLITLIISAMGFILLATGAYNSERLADTVEKVALNISLCAK